MTSVQDRIAFNPDPRIERVPLHAGHCCLIVDEALLEPERLVELAIERSADFVEVDFNAYPGILFPSPVTLSLALNEFFVQHIRRHFDARRSVHMHSRLALVTRPPGKLAPCQWLCHRDSVGIEPGQSIQASVLYLFRDPALGGTSFYEPKLSEYETGVLFHEASVLPAAAFADKYGLAPEYLCGSNRYFTRTASVPARWNRMIFYDGSVLHSGDITAPARLSADPALGRLTLNGFFTCRRRAPRGSERQ